MKMIWNIKVINDNIDGILCENTTEDWYKKLNEIIDNKEQREKIAASAYERVLKNYVTTYSGYKYTKFIKSNNVNNTTKCSININWKHFRYTYCYKCTISKIWTVGIL